MPQSTHITKLLLEWRNGRPEALDELFPKVYGELREIAELHLRKERRDHTFRPTDLVHEAYLKLVDVREIQWQDRSHFFAVAARAMRRLLISYARKRNAEKRGGGQQPLSLDDAPQISADPGQELIQLDDALRQLALLNERLANVVELRFFGGLTIEETAAVLDVSSTTVKRDWAKAKAWLYRELHTEPPAS